LEANQAISFFVKLQIACAAVIAQSQTLENSQTREKLVIKVATSVNDPTTISRYPMGTNEQEWIGELSQCPNIDANRRIVFDT
jgi:hypothetical protein